jgi:hypothetical protein
MVALLALSLASAGKLPAQDNRNSNMRQPTIEDRIGQLEQDQQNLISQVERLRNDIADLQDRVKRLEEEGKQVPPPPAAHSGRSSGSTNSREVNSREVQTPDSAERQSYDVFYRRLQSGGHWFDDPTYGEVWQPDVATSDGNWRPYSDGHWAYTDQGWTWISNEDFGWATYHYGRWARRSDTGWIWIPGSRWAPAWVSWRESNDHVGWAPLPPEVADDSQTRVGGWVDNYYDVGPAAYSFVKIGDLSRPTYRDVILTPANNVELFSRTKNVTDIVYGGNIVAVNGPRYEQLASQVKIPSYKLSYVTANEGRFGINPRGDQLEVMAPPPKLQNSATVQPKIEKALGQTQVERGWQQIDQEKTAQLKQTMEQQAPVPAGLPPKPTPAQPATANSQNQLPEKGRQQQTSGNPPSGSQAATQSQAPQATPTPQEQPPRAGSSPAPNEGKGRESSVHQENLQPRRPSQQESNAPREEAGRPPAPSPTPLRSSEGSSSPPPPPNAPRPDTRAPGESSPAPQRSIERREAEHPAARPTPSAVERSRSHTPATEQSPAREQPNIQNQVPGERRKEQSNEPEKQTEPRRNEPAEGRANDRTSQQENQREERKGQPGEPQRSPEARPRLEEKKSERANPEHGSSEKQESKKPKKEESQSQQPR